MGRLVLTVPCFTKIGSPLNPRKVVLCVIGSDDETAVGRLVVTGVTVPQYGVEGKHAVLYCRFYMLMLMMIMLMMTMIMGDCPSVWESMP